MKFSTSNSYDQKNSGKSYQQGEKKGEEFPEEAYVPGESEEKNDSKLTHQGRDQDKSHHKDL